MHRVLLIPDLLRLILQQISSDPLDSSLFFKDFINDNPLRVTKETRSTLRNAALACRAFEKPALDLLWWAMNDLNPLFALLDRDVEGSGSGAVQVIHQPISKEKLRTFSVYAKRIRFYAFASSNGIGPSSYISVLQATKRECLLPSLRYLSCGVSSPELLYLISPRLIGVHVSSYIKLSACLDIWTFIRLLPSRAQDIKFLNVKCPLGKSSLQYIVRLPKLAVLDISNSSSDTSLAVDFNDLKSLSATDLHGLSISGNGLFSLKKGLSEPPISFDSLTDLNLLLEHFGIDAVLGILETFHVANFPKLQKLRLEYPDEVRATQVALWREFFDSLSRATTSNFDSLSIKGALRSDWSPGLTLGMIPDIFQLPLTAFCEEQFLSSFPIEDCKLIANAWPRLETLQLDVVTVFQSVIELATGLPSLRCLRLPLSCTTIPRSLEMVPILAHSLSILQLFYTTPPAKPLHLGACLNRLFPYLNEWHLPDGEDIDEDEEPWRWSQVDEVLRILHSARTDQEKREESKSSEK